MPYELTEDFPHLHRAEVARRMKEHAAGEWTPLLATTAAVSPWIGHYIGIDTSDWTPNNDWPFLKSKGVHFGIAKAFEIQQGVSKSVWPQKTFATQIQGMYDAGMMQAGYMFQNGYAIAGENEMQGISLDAVKSMSEAEDHEFQYTKDAWKNTALSFWMIDVERWWQSYTEYNQYLKGQRAQADVKVMEPMFIMADLTAYINHLTTAIKQGRLPNIPLMIYTGKWFTESYLKSQGQNLFYNAAPGWKAAGITVCTAGYPAPAVTPATWEDLFAGKGLPMTAPFDAGFGSATMWQFMGDGYKLPNGTLPPQQFDLDLACVNNGTFDAMFGTFAPPDDHTCPDGFEWSDEQNKCVAKVVPVDNPDLVTVNAKLDAILANQAMILQAVNRPGWLK